MITKRRTWLKICTFYLLTLLFTALFDALDRRAHGNSFIAIGAMWCPALATIVTKYLFKENIRELPWKWASNKYSIFAYVFPLLYVTPVYILVWLTGLGHFYNSEFASKTANEFGLSSLTPPFAIVFYILIIATTGFIRAGANALGEEIGWRGFLVPELSKVTGFFGVGLISGLMWAIWHYPAILMSDYNSGTPAWYALSCFTIMVISFSYILAWFQKKTDSLWPATIMHASHNLFIQRIFTPLTSDTGNTAFYIDEFGVGIAITISLSAAILWTRRKMLS